MSNARATAIKQWFCLCGRHSRTKRRRNNTQKSVSNRCEYGLFISLKFMRRKPPKAFTSHRRRFGSRCVCMPPPPHTHTGRIYNFAFRCAVNVHVRSKAFQFCFFFSFFFLLVHFFVSQPKHWLYVLSLIDAEYIYKLQYRSTVCTVYADAPDKRIVCARTKLKLKQLSCIFIFFVNICL